MSVSGDSPDLSRLVDRGLGDRAARRPSFTSAASGSRRASSLGGGAAPPLSRTTSDAQSSTPRGGPALGDASPRPRAGGNQVSQGRRAFSFYCIGQNSLGSTGCPPPTLVQRQRRSVPLLAHWPPLLLLLLLPHRRRFACRRIGRVGPGAPPRRSAPPPTAACATCGASLPRLAAPPPTVCAWLVSFPVCRAASSEPLLRNASPSMGLACSHDAQIWYCATAEAVQPRPPPPHTHTHILHIRTHARTHTHAYTHTNTPPPPPPRCRSRHQRAHHGLRPAAEAVPRLRPDRQGAHRHSGGPGLPRRRGQGGRACRGCACKGAGDSAVRPL
jgi:hypothetical protein